MDVFGYFSGTTTAGAFTPATARVATNITLPANSVTDVRVTGVAGVPLEGAGISAVAMNMQETQTGTASGYLRVWNPDQAEPVAAVMNLDHAPSTVSNLVTVQVGANNDVNVRNASTDSLKLTIDVQGWYSNAGSAIPSEQRETQQSVTLQADPTNAGSWATYKYESVPSPPSPTSPSRTRPMEVAPIRRRGRSANPAAHSPPTRGICATPWPG